MHILLLSPPPTHTALKHLLGVRAVVAQVRRLSKARKFPDDLSFRACTADPLTPSSSPCHRGCRPLLRGVLTSSSSRPCAMSQKRILRFDTPTISLPTLPNRAVISSQNNEAELFVDPSVSVNTFRSSWYSTQLLFGRPGTVFSVPVIVRNITRRI